MDKTDNEIIAEFMKNDAINSPHIVKPDYRDWYNLMFVVEKIDKLMPAIKIPEDLEALKNGTHGSEEYINVLSLPLNTPIDEAYKAVVHFIKFYNENSTKEK